MRKLSLLILMMLIIGITFGCGNATQAGGNTVADPANVELPADVKARLANYEMTKSQLAVAVQEMETYKELYMNSEPVKEDNTTTEPNPEDEKEIETLKNQLNAKDNELTTLNKELMDKKGEVSSLNEKLEEMNTDLENTKNQLAEAMKASGVAPVDKTAIEEQILMKLVEFAKTKPRGDYLTAKINDFVAMHPEEKPKFAEALKTLADLTIIVPTYNADAVTTFTDISKLTTAELMKCPNAEDLPGIIFELIAEQIKFAKSADVAILIDTTSTMGDELDQIKRTITVLYPTLTSICNDVRISFVSYRDIKTNFGDPGYVNQIELSLTRNLRDIVMGARKISIETGGNYDVPEAVYEGLVATLKDVSWSSRAEKRCLLLIGDAPAGVGSKFLMHPQRGKTDLGAAHTVTLENVKEQIETLKKDMMTKDMPIAIMPIVCSEK